MDQMHEIDLKLNDLRKTYLLPAPLLHRRGQGKPKTKQWIRCLINGCLCSRIWPV